MKRIFSPAFAALCCILCAASPCAADGGLEVESDGSGWHLGAGGGILLPGNGNSLHRAAEAAVRGGYTFSSFFDLDLEGFCAPHAVSGAGATTVSAASLMGTLHASAWDEFDRLFGCERFDPFMSFGAGGRLAGRHVFADSSHRAAFGPIFALGAFYHLTDAWSLRADVRAQLCCDTPCGMLYGATVGVQYDFGGGGE